VLSEPRPDASRADDRAGSQLVVRVDGELDLFTGDALAQRLTALVAQRPREVVLDVSALTFCDSSGLAVLVNAEQAAKAQGVRIVLRSPTALVRRLLTITDLTGMLEADARSGEA